MEEGWIRVRYNFGGNWVDEGGLRYVGGDFGGNWARSHFSIHCKTDLVVNNISESFNSAICSARDKPILSMLEWIRNRMMKKIYDKHTSMAAYDGRYCPSIVRLLERNKVAAGNCFPSQSGENKFEVECGGTSNVVDVSAGTCTCRMWELTGIPCKHAIAAIHDCRQEPKNFVDDCYSKAVYMEVYKHYIDPMPSQDEWPVTDQQRVHPPLIRKPTGRPKKKRRRQQDERANKNGRLSRVGGPLHCGNCKGSGHNIRGCTAAITGETPWQRRKRLQSEKRAQSGEASTSNTKQRRNMPRKAKEGLSQLEPTSVGAANVQGNRPRTRRASQMESTSAGTASIQGDRPRTRRASQQGNLPPSRRSGVQGSQHSTTRP